jgi:hypothetical protein
MSDPKVFIIDEDATITTMFSDSLVDLGQHKISRASNVEPDPDGSWYVELCHDPIFGTQQGKRIGSGFKTRQEALDFEVNWINNFLKGTA